MQLSKMITISGAVLAATWLVKSPASASLRPLALSSFAEVVTAIQPSAGPVGRSDDELKDFARYANGALPAYDFPLSSLVNGDMTAAAERSVEDKSDLRTYAPKLVHANGICAVGEWSISAATPYSGYFAQGTHGLFVGRISSATPQTTSDEERSFGFAGKIFPTLNPNERIKTANFESIDVLTGHPIPLFALTELTNEPRFDLAHLGFFKRLGFERLQSIFRSADPHETIRPLYPIARAGLLAGDKPRTPKWMKLRISRETANPNATNADFRNELSMSRYPSGFTFEIFVSDQTKDVESPAWLRLGEIRIAQTIVSYGCDRRLFFTHATIVDPETER